MDQEGREAKPPSCLMMLKMEKEIEMENYEACLVDQVFDENVYRFGLGSSRRRMSFFQHFSTLPSAREVYNALFEIHHPNIARPTHVFSRLEKNKMKYLIGSDLGTGTSLYEFASDEKNKKLFFNAREDGTFYSVSDFYTTIISGLIKGMKELDETKIKASLKLEQIHIVYDSEDRRRKGIEEEDVGVRCVFIRYSLRNQDDVSAQEKIKTMLDPDAKRSALKEKDLAKPEWKELGALL